MFDLYQPTGSIHKMKVTMSCRMHPRSGVHHTGNGMSDEGFLSDKGTLLSETQREQKSYRSTRGDEFKGYRDNSAQIKWQV